MLKLAKNAENSLHNIDPRGCMLGHRKPANRESIQNFRKSLCQCAQFNGTNAEITNCQCYLCYKPYISVQV
jgi:hypothetical protein